MLKTYLLWIMLYLFQQTQHEKSFIQKWIHGLNIQVNII